MLFVSAPCSGDTFSQMTPFDEFFFCVRLQQMSQQDLTDKLISGSTDSCCYIDIIDITVKGRPCLHGGMSLSFRNHPS